MDNVNENLTAVMTRFRNFFIEHMRQDNVPFRRRKDFPVPLVTVMGHTYGVRLIRGLAEIDGEKPNLAIEVSANVYEDEFDLDRFKTHLIEAHQPLCVTRTIENFISPDETIYLKDCPQSFTSLFSYDVKRDIELVEKDKQTASDVTGRLVDTILTMKYWLRPEKLGQLSRDSQLFRSAVYLYCLRTFVLAYHKTLSSQKNA